MSEDPFADQVAAAIEFEGIAYVLPNGTRLFEGLDLLVHSGGVTAVSMPLGGGKSTLLRLAVGLVHPSAGRVRVLGRDPAAADPDGSLRRRIGYVPREGALLSNLSLLDNLMLPLRWHTELTYDEAKAKARAALDAFGVGELPALQPPSAGTALRRQVALARAIILDPAVLILDEPGAELDDGTARDVWLHLAGLAAQRGIAILAAAPTNPRVTGVHHEALAGQAAATRSWVQPRSHIGLPTVHAP